MKLIVLALITAAQAATIADGADCAKKLDANKKPLAREKCTSAKSCCMACVPGAGAKKANKDAKNKEYC